MSSWHHSLYFSSRILVYFGIILVMHGFRGHSFFLEYQWKENLVALIVIDRERTTSLYYRNFLEEKLKDELRKMRMTVAESEALQCLSDAEQIGDLRVVAKVLKDVDAEVLKRMALKIAYNDQNSVAVLGSSNGATHVVAAVGSSEEVKVLAAVLQALSAAACANAEASIALAAKLPATIPLLAMPPTLPDTVPVILAVMVRAVPPIAALASATSCFVVPPA
jgi:hypothetical protein